MKMKTILPLLPLLCLTLAPVLQAELSTKDKEYLEAFGWVISNQTRMAELGLTDEELAVLNVGFVLGSKGEPSPYPVETMGSDVQNWLRTKAAANKEQYEERTSSLRAAELEKTKAVAELNKKKGTEYIQALLKANKNIKETASGLYYEITEAGDDERVDASKKIEVHYRGTLIDGTEFDSSHRRKQPATFALNQVVPGWAEGLQLIGIGGKIKLYVPSHLAYGDMSRPSIEAGSLLIFDVEVLNIMSKKIVATTPPVSAEPPAEKK